MIQVPADLQYTKSHEWVRKLADGTVEIGITDHAQHSQPVRPARWSSP